MDFILLFLLFVANTVISTLAAADAGPPLPVAAKAAEETCSPVICGNTSVSFPFYIKGHQNISCGNPWYLLSCTQSSLYLNYTYKSGYEVLSIDYNGNSFIAKDTLTGTGHCGVPSVRVGSGFSVPMATISNSNQQLLFLFDCQGLQEPQLESSAIKGPYVEKCNSNLTYVYLAQNYQFSSTQNCRMTDAPVRAFPGDALSDYKNIIARGFEVEFDMQNCSICRHSGGECRYLGYEAACLCGNGKFEPISCCNSNDNKTKRNIIIGVVTGFTSITVVVLCVLFINKRKKSQRRSLRSTDDLDASVAQSTQIFSYEELSQATDGFDESNELGDGGFGTVYKGKLKDGRIVAVKRLYKNYRQVEQFMNEVVILSCLRHPNLVILYGCTSRRSEDLILVYEFIPNGTVADHLHGLRANEHALTWPIRLNIAIETADALAFLHATEVIHRDVKTNNILLDNGYHVKVADFGLSRTFPLNATHVSTVPQGTPGYVDPVYHLCYQLNDKSDVYSFGVVLVELISSKAAVDMSRSEDEINLANMAVKKIQRLEIEQLVDPQLHYGSDIVASEMINKVAELAFRCLQAERHLRPTIKEVLETLKLIQKGQYNIQMYNKQESIEPQDEHLLKKFQPSPNTVMDSWKSRSTESTGSV